MDKPLLTIDEQIAKMQEKGITFNYCTQDEAYSFLARHNNYFRLTSYRKLYDKYPAGVNKGKYRDLDFQYLRELSTIDMHLRFLIIKMCLDIEHYLKMDLLFKAEMVFDDGYESIKQFFALKKNRNIEESIYHKRFSPYCADLVNYCFKFADNGKYISNFEKCRIWGLLECLTFGEFLRFYNFYHREYHIVNVHKDTIPSVKSLRNACAHNNCILAQLKSKMGRPNWAINDFVSGIDNISANAKKERLKIRPIYEIISVIYMYQILVPESIKQHRFSELKEFVNGRMVRHKDYFETQPLIKSSYDFIKKIVDFL